MSEQNPVNPTDPHDPSAASGEPTPPPYGAPQYGTPDPGAQQPYGAPQGQAPYGQAPYGQQYPQSPYGAMGPGTMQPSDERTWMGLAHFGGLLLGFLAPLIVMLVKGNESQKVRESSVEALNFQISYMIYLLVSTILVFVLVGILMLIVLIPVYYVFMILGGIKALNGESYRYPLILRLVS